MATAVIMPKQGQSVESCIITRWNKAVGDQVKAGDVLFEYETDKASFEEEAKEDGVLLAILAEEGDDVPCFENVAVIGQPGEDVSAFTAKAEAASEEQPQAAQQPAQPQQETAKAAATVNDEDFIKISPRAKNAAEEAGLDISRAVPTGPEGRIIERDILELAKQGDAEPAAEARAEAPVAPAVREAEYEDVKLSGVRKAIAKSMTLSLSTMAQLTNNASFDATSIMAYRKLMKENGEKLGLANINLNHMVMYAAARVLKNHPDINAHFLDDKIRRFKSVNLGMAVDTARGLLVPTIFGADTMSLNQIAEAAKSLAEQANGGSISPDLLTGGTFTVTNLGSLGVTSFTPVINPPQTAILGVCSIEQKIKVIGGEIKAYPAMGLSLTYDHRAVDGAPAARFLKELIEALENFSALLAK